MIYQALAQTILDRLKADTGTGGLYNGGNWSIITGAWNNVSTPDVSLYPYIVYSFESTSIGGPRDDMFQVDITFTVYDQSIKGTDRLSPVLDRLHGDGILQSNGLPTYGFHRWVPVLPTNGYSATGNGCIVQSTTMQPLDEKITVATSTFRMIISAQAV